MKVWPERIFPPRSLTSLTGHIINFSCTAHSRLPVIVNRQKERWSAQMLYILDVPEPETIQTFPDCDSIARQDRTDGKWAEGQAENERNIGRKQMETVNMWAEKQQMGSILEFISRMGYHFRQKIGRKSAEICRICKFVGGKTADRVPSVENQQ